MMIPQNEQVDRNGAALHPREGPPVQGLGLDRRIQRNSVDPKTKNQLPINKTLVRSGVQEDRERKCLILPQENGFQEGKGHRGVTGAARQDPSGYWQARSGLIQSGTLITLLYNLLTH